MHPDQDDPRLTAYAFGELEGDERAELDEHLRDCADCRQAVEALRGFGVALSAGLKVEPLPERAITLKPQVALRRRAFRWKVAAGALATAATLFVVVGLMSYSGDRVGSNGTNQVVHHAPSLPSPYWQTDDVQRFPAEPKFTISREAAAASAAKQQVSDLAKNAGGQGAGQNAAPASPGAPGLPGLASAPAHGFGARGQGSRQEMLAARHSQGRTIPATSAPGLQIAKSGMGGVVGSMGGGTGQAPQVGLKVVASNDATWSRREPDEQSQPEQRERNEAYGQLIEQPFKQPTQDPLSTFSTDVDTGAYANVRRFLTQENRRPPTDAVRIEELLNYFKYDYAPPKDDKPFAAHIDVAGCPWNAEHRLVRIGLKGREIANADRPPANLVFLLDVSGSMQPANKLPLVIQSMKMLLEKLNARDRVAIVTYAGNSGVALPSTSCDEKEQIVRVLDSLQAGGSTNGSGGIQQAYDIARENFVEQGTNRVILCTDGDFNVGISDRAQLISLIEEKAKSRVFLSAFGFGTGNLKDATLEQLADHGNGVYGYIDGALEARKVFVEQLSGTLVTIAKDVKIQVEFNPAKVASYRLIGYENRKLEHYEFNDDKKDAGDIGAGHTVTALYEIVLAGQANANPAVDPLKYQKPAAVAKPDEAQTSAEMLTVKLRYKQPDGDTSKLLEFPVTDAGRTLAQASDDFRFAAAVAEFGLVLRESQFRGTASLEQALELAQHSLGEDRERYRTEFLDLVRKAMQVAR